MAYFKINEIDFSRYVNKLKVSTKYNANTRVNAAGNTLAQYINTKRIIEVGIIPLDADAMKSLQEQLEKFDKTILFLNPKTNQLYRIKCLLTQQSVEYYTIQDSKVKFQAFSLVFEEL
jgi:hypothetical protein